ncbi:histidine kinase-like ATPase [Pilobolus umbonatus]|nr:histidine kinase-like ATPase [Pilobolus umbonatus]
MIICLDPSVISRIAAGEIVHCPANVVKELIENSLDASAHHIQITVSNGGLDLVRITDDGTGIQLEDMSLVCQKHATSKLQKFDDLGSITTFGFRGEALSSISHIADVSIISKTEDSPCGFKVIYKNGTMVNRPISCAANTGTVITIQRMFENEPMVRKRLKSSNEEYKRTLEIIKKYAVHNYKIAYTIRKNTTIEHSYSETSTIKERIGQVYGLSKHLTSTQYKESKWSFDLTFIDQQDVSTQSTFILFVNNRLVDNQRMKKEIYQAYKELTEKKPHFIYLSLNIYPPHVDVNIHPTKNKVRILNEDTMVDTITRILKDLLQCNKDKKRKSTSKCPHEQTTLDSYFQSNHRIPTKDDISKERPASSWKPKSPCVPLKCVNKKNNTPESKQTMAVVPDDTSTQISDSYSNRSDECSPFNGGMVEDDLQSIFIMEKEVLTNEDKSISKLLSGLHDIGYIDDVLALGLYHNCYYLVHQCVISEELFYQMIIRSFGRMGTLHLETSLSIHSCLELVVDNLNDIRQYKTVIYQYSDILKTYFSIVITKKNDDYHLCQLPIIINDYIPSLNNLPVFLLNLATKVNWTQEIECFDAIIREISYLYHCSTNLQWSLVLNQLHRGIFKAPKYLSRHGHIVQVDVINEYME